MAFQHAVQPGMPVVYVGELVPALTGRRGVFRYIGRNGWAVCDFAGESGVKVALANLVPAYAACGSCGHYHRADYRGDCRNDAERFTADDLERWHGPNILDYVEGEGAANA